MDNLPKTDKITRVLVLYHQLLNGKHVDKSIFSMEHGINERSFDRDIEDIRLFLSEIYSAQEVVFDKDTSSYYMTGERPSFLDRMDAAVIAKLLISSYALRADEMHGLLEALLAVVTPRDGSAIKSYLQQDLDSYASGTDTAIMKMLGDLYGAIQDGADIEIVFRQGNSMALVKQVSPLEIKVEDSMFYLVAAENMNASCIVQYRLDQIDNFKHLKSSFARTLGEQYNYQKRAINKTEEGTD